MKYINSGGEGANYLLGNKEMMKVHMREALFLGKAKAFGNSQVVFDNLTDAYLNGINVQEPYSIEQVKGKDLPFIPEFFRKIHKRNIYHLNEGLEDMIFPAIRKEFKPGLVLSDNRKFSSVLRGKVKSLNKSFIENGYYAHDFKPSNYVLSYDDDEVYFCDESGFMKLPAGFEGSDIDVYGLHTRNGKIVFKVIDVFNELLGFNDKIQKR